MMKKISAQRSMKSPLWRDPESVSRRRRAISARLPCLRLPVFADHRGRCSPAGSAGTALRPFAAAAPSAAGRQASGPSFSSRRWASSSCLEGVELEPLVRWGGVLLGSVRGASCPSGREGSWSARDAADRHQGKRAGADPGASPAGCPARAPAGSAVGWASAGSWFRTPRYVERGCAPPSLLGNARASLAEHARAAGSPGGRVTSTSGGARLRIALGCADQARVRACSKAGSTR